MIHYLSLIGWVCFLVMCLIALSEVVVAAYAVIKGEREYFR